MTAFSARPLWMLVPLAALAAAASWVQACGPDWVQLLPQRQRELREPIPRVLAAELKAVALPSPLDAALRKTLAADAAQQADPQFETADSSATRRLKAQQQGLAAADAQAFAAARQAASAEAAEAAAPDIPVAWRRYAAAAVEVRLNHADAARQRLQQLLALPPDQAKPAAVWAAYSLGRLLAASGDNAAAAKAFADTRRWRGLGAPDPLGLAVDSLGEEARLHLPLADEDEDEDEGKGEGQGQAASRPTAGADDEFLAALRLYFEQARLGSRSGVDSLRQLQAQAIEPARLKRLLAQDWGQALLVRLLGEQGAWVDEPGARQHFHAVTAVLAAQPGATLAEPERWAALAWQHGDLAHARQWAGDKPTTSLGAWTRAKLALTQGDTAGAAQWFAAAVKAWPKTADAAQLGRLRAEQGLLQLQRGELPLGLRALVAAGDTYLLDAGFVAERLLTSAELRSVVDDIAPAGATGRAPAMLRHLLARRLMREGDFATAAAYFPTHHQIERWAPEGNRTETLDLAALSRQYADAINSADRAWSRIGRAESLLAAGALIRQYGMELMGFELAPDGAAVGGSFDMDGGAPQDKVTGTLEARRLAQPPATQPLPPSVRGAALPRFHYRYVAAQLALQAADVLPARSQAFASSLCHAALWVGRRDDAFGRAMWTRYVREGAYVPWAASFGQDCPAPEILGARWLQARQDVQRAAPWLPRHPWRSAAAAALATAALLAAFAWRRRRGSLPPA